LQVLNCYSLLDVLPTRERRKDFKLSVDCTVQPIFPAPTNVPFLEQTLILNPKMLVAVGITDVVSSESPRGGGGAERKGKKNNEPIDRRTFQYNFRPHRMCMYAHELDVELLSVSQVQDFDVG
jgi:hypothetical protein